MADSLTCVDAEIWPEGSLEVLSQHEVDLLKSTGSGGLYPLMRRCLLAVLTSGSEFDDAKEVLQAYCDFEVGFFQQDRGLRVSLKNAPANAFVDGRMIRGTRELLSAVLRDIVYTRHEIFDSGRFDLESSDGITNAVFHIVRNARILVLPAQVNMVVCWGGHAIIRNEYDYSKQVGYEMGLRGLDICTGCGPGAMKGPMTGATIGHAKQRIRNGRYVGITEPGIISSESPNPIVNSLVIMPDMEKRLEAFVRTGHAIVVLPGGVGTAEEFLYLLGVLLHPDNDGQPLPVVLTGPASAKAYFQQIDEFVGATLGAAAQNRYKIIIGDPRAVAQEMKIRLNDVLEFRERHGDAYYFNWRLTIDREFQTPFVATHESMHGLDISENLPAHVLAANLRRVFSGIVAGNVREDTAEQIERNGPFHLHGSKRIMDMLDRLLAAFVEQKRMKVSGKDYNPCYVIK